MVRSCSMAWHGMVVAKYVWSTINKAVCQYYHSTNGGEILPVNRTLWTSRDWPGTLGGHRNSHVLITVLTSFFSK